ncbi:MAG: hypothetical protein EAS48_10130 [Chryseobacterium sp.]|nr:MAG: hypothetical protein EAS48_10130 [Chryseobacterium sp.]
MKSFRYKNRLSRLLRGGLLSVGIGLTATSCVIQTGGYSETDGAYYDPYNDTMPAVADRSRVGDYYGEDYTTVTPHERQRILNNRRQSVSDSDWGTYTGTVTQYSGWDYYGYPYGWSPYMGFGYGFPYGGWYGSFNYGFGSPWYSSYYGFYSPFYGYYSPYYYGYYSPYYNYYYAQPLPRKQSGVDTGFGGPAGIRTGNTNRSSAVAPGIRQQNSGFRSTQFRNGVNRSPDTYRNQAPQRNTGWEQQRGNFRSNSDWNSGQMRSTPNYQSAPRSSGSAPGGFRTGGFR